MDEDTPELKGRQHDSRPNARIWCAETTDMPEQVWEMDEDTLHFLTGLFPNIPPADLTKTFNGLFGVDPFGPDQDKVTRADEIADLNRAIERLENLSSDEGKGNIYDACSELEEHALDYAEIRTPGITVQKALDGLADYKNLSETWNKAYPRTGGRNVNAKLLAETVAYLFMEIGEKITFGTYPEVKTIPSTPFGKVVERAFKFHQVGASWISPAEKVARGVKKGTWP